MSSYNLENIRKSRVPARELEVPFGTFTGPAVTANKAVRQPEETSNLCLTLQKTVSVNMCYFERTENKLRV